MTLTWWRRARAWAGATALVAAYALALQALLLAFAGAGHAVAPAGQGILCVAGETGPDEAPAPHGAAPLCCILCDAPPQPNLSGAVAPALSAPARAPVVIARGDPPGSPRALRPASFPPVGSRAPPALG